MKFIQAFNLSGKATREEFYRLTQDFFRGCGPVGLGRERGKVVSLAAHLHLLACRRLSYGLYRPLFCWEAVLTAPQVNACLRRRLQR